MFGSNHVVGVWLKSIEDKGDGGGSHTLEPFFCKGTGPFVGETHLFVCGLTLS